MKCCMKYYNLISLHFINSLSLDEFLDANSPRVVVTCVGDPFACREHLGTRKCPREVNICSSQRTVSGRSQVIAQDSLTAVRLEPPPHQKATSGKQQRHCRR